jgi:hypothetical protein
MYKIHVSIEPLRHAVLFDPVNAAELGGPMRSDLLAMLKIDRPIAHIGDLLRFRRAGFAFMQRLGIVRLKY